MPKPSKGTKKDMRLKRNRSGKELKQANNPKRKKKRG